MSTIIFNFLLLFYQGRKFGGFRRSNQTQTHETTTPAINPRINIWFPLPYRISIYYKEETVNRFRTMIFWHRHNILWHIHYQSVVL
jgi:hypothetical protein